MASGIWLRLRSIRSEEGSALVELSLLVPVLLYFFVGAIDFGRAYYVAIEVASSAEAGALYGVKNPSDVSGIESAAAADGSGLASFSAVADYGCECDDGSSAVGSCSSPPTCTTNYVNYVDVTASTTYNFLLKYPGMPASLVMSSKSRIRVGGD